MRRYTTTTFTRRADHEGGHHRDRKSPPEPILCAGCGAIYAHKRWSHVPAVRVRALAAAGPGPIDVRVCPACRRRESGVPHGFVHIDGEFATAHRDEIVHLLHNESARALEDNPLSQVLDWGDDGTGGLLVTTTTEHLAIRLGRAVEKAFDGRLLYGFSHENKLAHVWWHRPLP